MQSVDIMIKNGTILVMDTKNSIVNRGFLCIEGDTISYIGTGNDKNFEAKK